MILFCCHPLYLAHVLTSTGWQACDLCGYPIAIAIRWFSSSFGVVMNFFLKNFMEFCPQFFFNQIYASIKINMIPGLPVALYSLYFLACTIYLYFPQFGLCFQQFHQINRFTPKKISKFHGPQIPYCSCDSPRFVTILIYECTLGKSSCKIIFQDYLYMHNTKYKPL